MDTNCTTSFDEATKLCKPFRRLRFPKSIESLLNSGIVLYYFTKPPCWSCWPYFPIGSNRIIVKELNQRNVLVPKSVKVIIEANLEDDLAVEESMLDCFGHTILYLTNPKATNECKDSIKIIEKLGIYYTN